MGIRQREKGRQDRAARAEPGGSLLDGITIFAFGLLVGLAAVVIDVKPFAARPGKASGVGPVHASSPRKIPLTAWKSIFGRTWRELNSDHITAVAGGATFFALLALFPALAVFVSLYGLFGDVAAARLEILQMHGVLPDGAISVLNDQMTRLSTTPRGGLSLTFATSFLLSLWASNAGAKALITGLNVAYEQTERRGFIALNLLSLGFTIGGVVIALAGAAGAGLLARLGLQGAWWVRVLQWPVALGAVMGVLSLLYRYAPCREHARWRWITPGSAFAALAWLAMSMLFALYVANFGHYDKTYGPLGAVVGFMTWIWLSLTVVLIGAELNAEIESQVEGDTTTGAPRPAGHRGGGRRRVRKSSCKQRSLSRERVPISGNRLSDQTCDKPKI